MVSPPPKNLQNPFFFLETLSVCYSCGVCVSVAHSIANVILVRNGDCRMDAVGDQQVAVGRRQRFGVMVRRTGIVDSVHVRDRRARWRSARRPLVTDVRPQGDPAVVGRTHDSRMDRLPVEAEQREYRMCQQSACHDRFFGMSFCQPMTVSKLFFSKFQKKI